MDSHTNDGYPKQENESDFSLIKLKHRGMANLKFFKGTETTILGHKVSAPIGVAPLERLGIFDLDGELSAAVMAKELNLMFG